MTPRFHNSQQVSASASFSASRVISACAVSSAYPSGGRLELGPQRRQESQELSSTRPFHASGHQQRGASTLSESAPDTYPQDRRLSKPILPTDATRRCARSFAGCSLTLPLRFFREGDHFMSRRLQPDPGPSSLRLLGLDQPVRNRRGAMVQRITSRRRGPPVH